MAATLLLAVLVIGSMGCGNSAAPTPTRRPRLTATPCDKCGKDRSRPTPTPEQPVAIGWAAPEPAHRTGRQVWLSDQRGQAAILDPEGTGPDMVVGAMPEEMIGQPMGPLQGM